MRWPSGVAISMDGTDVTILYWLEKSRFSGVPGLGLHAGGLFIPCRIMGVPGLEFTVPCL